MVTEANLLQHHMGNTDEIIIDKTYFKIAGDSNNDSDGQGGNSSDREPNSQNQLNDFVDMVKALQEAQKREEARQKALEAEKKFREQIQQYVQQDVETTEALQNAWREEENTEDVDFEDVEEDWFNGEGKGSNLDDVDADSNQKEVKQVDSERVNVNRKLRNFFGY